MAGVVEKTLGVTIGFGQWMLFGLPLSTLMLIVCWGYLIRITAQFPAHASTSDGIDFSDELAQLGPMTTAEKRVAGIFAAVAFLGVFKGILPIHGLNTLHDATIAMAGAILLFVIPGGRPARVPLLDWKSASRIPWDVLILFGGGFALAQGFQQSGLTEWIGQQLGILQSVHWSILLFGVVLVTIFLTEVTSNTATAGMLLPIVAGLASAAGHDALLPMVGTALAASFAFMLPVATPPNAIVFASRQLSIAEMARAGIWMNLIGLAMIMLFVSLVLPLLWR